ncbi:unnamed protein product, partial [Rotaria sp. Silwood1]
QLTRRRKMANVLFKIDISHALCTFMNDSILIDMATPFQITCVTRNTGSGGVQQLVTIVTLVSIDRKHREQLLGQFIQRQKAVGKTINDFLQQTIPVVRLEIINNIYSRIDNLLQALFETLDTIELQLDANSILFHRQKDGS